MNEEEFLKRVGLNRRDFISLLHRLNDLKLLLNKAQWDAVERTLPTAAEAVQRFGSGVNEKQLTDIVSGLASATAAESGNEGFAGSKFFSFPPGYGVSGGNPVGGTHRGETHGGLPTKR